MSWFSPDTTIIDIVAALGSLATVFTVLFAAVAVRQTGQARNLSSIVELAQQLNQERARAFDAKVYDMDAIAFHVFQMTNLVEHACFLVNKKLVNSYARAFLLEWLRAEIEQMDGQEAYRLQFASLPASALTELKALRLEFQREDREKAHWDKVISGQRWRAR